MTEQVAVTVGPEAGTEMPVPVSRKELRQNLLGKKQEGHSRVIELFGQKVELRSPSLKDIMSAREEASATERAADMIIKYACVPGTQERIFDEADRDLILEWPFGKDLARLNTAIAEMTGVDISAAEEDLKEDPLDARS